MGFTKSLFGGSKGSGFQAQGAPLDNPFNVGQVQGSYDQAQGGISQQQDFLNALAAQNGAGNLQNVFSQYQGIANGTGPNPAQAQLNQATGQNVASQAALMAGQRGAGANSGLMARQIANQGAGIQQQAAGQAATMNAQQQLAALGQMGGIAGQQVGAQQQALSGYNQAALNQAQLATSGLDAQNKNRIAMQSNINNANAGVAGKNADTQGGILGGALGGLGSAAMNIFNKVAPAVLPAASIMAGDPSGGAALGTMFASHGGAVPGQPKVFGDSQANDIVPAKLSPGEIVIPRSVLESENPALAAAHFVQQELSKPSSKKNLYDGGSAGLSPFEEDIGITPEKQQAMHDFYAKRNAVAGGNIPQGIPESTAPAVVPGAPGPAIASVQPGIPDGAAPAGLAGGQGELGLANVTPESAAAAPVAPKAGDPETAGIFQEAKAKDVLGQQKAAIEKQKQVGLEQRAADYNKAYQGLEQERAGFMDAVKNQQIDPTKYLGDMSTGQRVSTAIGLILGGIGGGILHQENPALKYLNSQIDRDIDAQKSELGKKQNLLSMNMQKFGQLDQAMQATRIQMMDLAGSKLEQAGAEAEGPVAKARALQAKGQLDTKRDTAQKEFALKLSESETKKRTAQATANENYVPSLNVYATSKEGAGKINELAGATRSAQSGIGELLSLANQSGKSVSPETRAKADTIASTVRAALRVPILGPGTVNDAERKLMEKIVANPASIFSLDDVSKVRLNALSRRLETNLVQNAKAYQAPGGANLKSDMIKVRKPNGEVGMIPADQTNAALAKKWEVL